MDYMAYAHSIMQIMKNSDFSSLSGPFNQDLIEGPRVVYTPEEALPVSVESMRLVEDSKPNPLAP